MSHCETMSGTLLVGVIVVKIVVVVVALLTVINTVTEHNPSSY